MKTFSKETRRESAAYWIRALRLRPHPEGGYFREVYRSPRRFGKHACATHIYYLLREHECSRLHRIASDEAWHFYAGDPLCVPILAPGGGLEVLKLGRNPRRKESLFGIVPARHWFGAYLQSPVEGSFALVGCTVSPGFDFKDLSMADRERLTRTFPRHRALIRALTPEPVLR